jgi:hypothetical protein
MIRIFNCPICLTETEVDGDKTGNCDHCGRKLHFCHGDSGIPDWLRDVIYDVELKIGEAEAARIQKEECDDSAERKL